MTSRERVVVYGMLAALLVMTLPGWLSTGSTVHADPSPAAELGPTDALVLTGTDGNDLVVRNRGGRLSWKEDASHRAYSMGFVHVGAILRQLMSGDEMAEDRDRLFSELNEEGTQFQTQLQGISEQLQNAERDSDEFQRLYEQGMAIQERYVAWQQEAMAKRGRLDAEHLERAYGELVTAVEVVADRRGIDLVHRFIPTRDPFQAENPEQAMAAIRLRSALRYPDALDLTDAVLEELSLDREP